MIIRLNRSKNELTSVNIVLIFTLINIINIPLLWCLNLATYPACCIKGTILLGILKPAVNLSREDKRRDYT